ncbi:MAG: GtrA family protein [Nostoc sp.]|uniref:GtrA family protein n=1 Tax=Nostoc sp. TaxID=1180 RepID=UPI002FFD2E76
MSQKTAIIIGAGPAGLTAAYELLEQTDIKPIIYEMSNEIGGISRTVKYKGYRMDIGGHRFFSKSDVVMDWWLQFMPIESVNKQQKITLTYQNKSRDIQAKDEHADPDKEDMVMLVRNRKSRIYFLRKFFDYPITLSKNTLTNLGLIRTYKILISYLYIRAFPIKKEKNLEEFFINRFGNVLYRTFFKSYTEKVWGVPCSEISAEWGAQRIKGFSIAKAIQHIFKRIFNFNSGSLAQKDIETSLIERFLYPKLGPGQLWEEVAERVKAKGGEIHLNTGVRKLFTADGNKITAVEIYNSVTQKIERLEGDFFISTMPIKDLIRGLQANVPSEIGEISEGLGYRDFITVGLLVEKLSLRDVKKGEKLIQDNWIYVQEPDVSLGRIQIFNNWSSSLVQDPSKVWLGLEYFCNESDYLWKMADDEFAKFAIQELEKIGFICQSDVLDSTVIRVPKTYPAYFGTYSEFDRLKLYINDFENLFLVGRNGMHRYNNQDHSMLTAMAAVENIKNGVTDKSAIWEINTEQEYHETKPEANSPAVESNSRYRRKPATELTKQFVSYLFTGGSATVVDVFIFFILIKSGMWYVLALCISSFFGLTTNFLLTRRFVFNVYWANPLAQYGVFAVVAINGFFANLGLLQLLMNELRIDATLARLVSAACIALINFAGHKLYSFSSNLQSSNQLR